jgi:hypothetical protein
VATDALRTLQVILEITPYTNLSENSRAEIVNLARARLTGRQHGAVIAAACDLAIATHDAKLRARVERLADHPSELIQMGVTDPNWLAFVQRAATRAVAKKGP